MRDLRITIRPPAVGRNHLEVIVAVERGNQTAPFPCWVGTLQGVEADFLVTLVSEATSTWAYGEDVRDVQKTCAVIKKQARAHRRAHEL